MSRRNTVGQPDFDVAIVGGSTVGASLAALLGQGGMRIALIEPSVSQPYDAAQDLDGRVLALTVASERILRRIGVWSTVEKHPHTPFGKMLVWDAAGAGRVSFDSADLCEPALGYIVGSGLLQSGIESALQTMPQIQWYRPARLERFALGTEQTEVYLDDGRRVSARLLVGADGASSIVRAQAGIGVDGRDYDQTAITCVAHTQLPHGSTARQRFLPTGPLAFLPLSDPHACSIVWSNGTDEAAQLMALTEQTFQQALTEAFASELGQVTQVGKRSAFPLARAHAQRYVQHRLALVGDAAHRIHPLAGQGANLGLLDAASLAEVLFHATSEQHDVGSLRVLRRYERWRRGQNLAMMLAMDAFKDGFGTGVAPVRWLRKLGLDLVNRSSSIQRIIMRRAMGLAGDLPAMVAPGPV